MHILTIPLQCQRGQLMHLNKIDQNHPMPAKTKMPSTCVCKTLPMPARKQNASQTFPRSTQDASQHLLSKLPHIQANGTTKSQHVMTNPMLVRTQKVSQHVFSKPIPCQRVQKIHLITC
jgi:hypothetical protein